MKRYPLLIQLIVYIFLLVLVLLGLVGSLYYQTSSGTIRQLTDRTTRNSMEQSGQFIASYLQKLKQTTSTLSKEEAIRKFAQNQESSETPVQTLMKTIIETDPDLYFLIPIILIPHWQFFSISSNYMAITRPFTI